MNERKVRESKLVAYQPRYIQCTGAGRKLKVGRPGAMWPKNCPLPYTTSHFAIGNPPRIRGGGNQVTWMLTPFKLCLF